MIDYSEYVGMLKAIADNTRLLIVDMISCGELCACRILERFDITQPTLSHHMKILCDSGLVTGRKEGKWVYYSINHENMHQLQDFLGAITQDKPDCICVQEGRIRCEQEEQ